MVAEKIQSNWLEFLGYIHDHIQSPRKEKLLEFYEKYGDRIAMMPASHKKEYHNAFIGGYVDHVNRVVKCALALHKIWADMGSDITTYTKEELIFSALNHDLGKMGDSEHEAYLPNTDQWRKEKLGEEFMFNKALAFSSVPDRSLFLLQSHGISYSFNEMLAIQIHDGLYDEANKKYLIGYLPEQKLRTALPLIIHQADFMAARIEFEQEWLFKFKNSVPQNKFSSTLSQNNMKPTLKPNQAKQKALSSVKSEGLRSMLDNL